MNMYIVEHRPKNKRKYEVLGVVKTIEDVRNWINQLRCPMSNARHDYFRVYDVNVEKMNKISPKEYE